jgi:hypothetical protein
VLGSSGLRYVIDSFAVVGEVSGEVDGKLSKDFPLILWRESQSFLLISPWLILDWGFLVEQGG